jgi:hypothetical protein
MKILLIAFPPRVDLFNYLTNDKINNYEVLWFENEKEFVKTDVKLNSLFCKQHFWNNYSTPKALLKDIKPDRIVFMEIIDQREIALIVAANKFNIPTFYLEHGSAGDKETAIKRQITSKNESLKRFKNIFLRKIFISFIHAIRVKYFYYSNTFSNFDSLTNYKKYLKLPFLMFWYLPNKALSDCIFYERVPKKSIVFNKLNFEEYQLYTGISEEGAVFTGLPFYDEYYYLNYINKDYIVYIEHPMLESGLLEWDKQHHEKIANTLLQLAVTKRVKIYVKLHPSSDLSLWTSYMNQSPFFEIIQSGNYMDLYLSSKLIIGYSSSLITGFLCAKKNVVNIGWHPTPQIFGIDFSKYKICHQSLDISEITVNLDYWINTNLAEVNRDAYKTFISLFNNPFDGKASERVINCINNA